MFIKLTQIGSQGFGGGTGPIILNTDSIVKIVIPTYEQKKYRHAENAAYYVSLCEDGFFVDSYNAAIIFNAIGISFDAPSSAGGAAQAAAPVRSPAPDAQRSEYKVVLTKCGPYTIDVIKVVREYAGLGLIEAKKLVEGAPKTVKSMISFSEAVTIKKALEEAGASAEIE